MTDTPEQTSLNLDSPGQILRDAREKKQLDIQSIAKHLHLSTEIVSAIEDDDYEKISAPTYTRGYLRSYAKIVDVDDESLINLYNSFLEHTNDPEIIPEVSQKSQVTSSDKPVKLVTYLISLALVLLLLTWWQSKYQLDDSSPVVDEEPIIYDKTVPPAFDYDFTVIEHPAEPFYTLEDSSQETTLPDNEVSPQVVEDNITDSVTESNDSNTGLTGNLVLKVEQESWIEVYNTHDRRLFHKLAQAGSVVNITGLVPLSVLLGNAQGVQVEFNGENIDILPFTRANVARLTLGE